jgi:hypothetical protein
MLAQASATTIYPLKEQKSTEPFQALHSSDAQPKTVRTTDKKSSELDALLQKTQALFDKMAENEEETPKEKMLRSDIENERKEKMIRKTLKELRSSGLKFDHRSISEKREAPVINHDKEKGSQHQGSVTPRIIGGDASVSQFLHRDTKILH